MTGAVVVASNSWIYLSSHPTNGGSVLLHMGSLRVLTPGAGISAENGGYVGGYYAWPVVHDGFGPGGGANGPYGGAPGGGGGHGGAGGTYNGYGSAAGGPSYDSTNAPLAPGSGGGNYGGQPLRVGGTGGGAVRIVADGSVVLKGSITADGQIGHTDGSDGCGAGGSIFIRCLEFDGLSGTILARGGSKAEDAGGGGGRIALWIGDIGPADETNIINNISKHFVFTNNPAGYLQSASVDGGIGEYSGSPGTMFFAEKLPPAGTVISIR